MSRFSIRKIAAYAIIVTIISLFFGMLILGWVMSVGWEGTLIVFGGVAVILLLIGGVEWARKVLDEGDGLHE